MEKDDRVHDLYGLLKPDRSGGKRMNLPSDLTWEPATDVIETERELIVVIDISGMNGDDIDVVTDGKVLKISGYRKHLPLPEKRQFHKMEIQVGRFGREIDLLVPVDPSKVSARYRDGFLEVRIRKLDDAERVRKIQID
jgi:HSP20 family protein